MGDNYLSNRCALVGSGCMVNRLGSDGVKVVPVVTNLENLVDEDLTNVTNIGLVADVSAGINPLVSVKDVKNYYAAGTTVGFKFNQATALNLGIGTGYAIALYDRNDNQVYHKVLSLDVLGISIGKGEDGSKLWRVKRHRLNPNER